MGKSPKDPKELLADFVSDCRQAFGDGVLSVVLYGSAAGDDYEPGRSDVNLLVVLSEQAIEELERAFSLTARWRKRGVAVPLFLTEDYIRRSLDAFPVEYLDLQRRHLLVYGKDVLKSLRPEPRYVRLQCEREAKGKLLLLREAYLETGGAPKALRDLIFRSLGAVLAILEALLQLEGSEIPKGRRAAVRAACRRLGLDGSLFDELLDIRQGRKKPGSEELRTIFKKYLSQMKKISDIVDGMEANHA